MTPLRPLFAWALLGYAALQIFFTFARWIEPNGLSFPHRAVNADFTTLITIGFPILAVLVAVLIKPVLSMAKIMAAVAIAEYAAILSLGGMAFIVGLVRAGDFDQISSILSYFVLGVAELLIAALCAFACVRMFLEAGGRLPVKLDG